MSAIDFYTTDYRAIYISGKDAKSFLHGQLTQDMNRVSSSQWLWAGQCSAKGKLWACHRVFAFDQGFVLVTTAPEFEAALRELKKYGVFSAIEIVELEHPVSGIIAGQEAIKAHFNLNELSAVTSTESGTLLQLDSDLYLLIGTHEGERQDGAAFKAAHITKGLPALNEAAIDQYVPQMLNLQAIDGISFKKGCYTGQETVARMKFLGKNKRAMFILQGPLGNSELTLADDNLDLEYQLGENWRRGGSVVSHAIANNNLHALAVLPNDLEMSTTLRLKHAPEIELTLVELPYSLTEE